MFTLVYNGEKEKKTVKELFGEIMREIIEADEDVVYLDCDLMNSFGMTKLWKQYPERVINCGVMEATMMGVAGGLSAAGKKPYAHTFGPFASRRAFDQTYISIAYAKNSARIIGSDAGVCAAYNGGTHMPLEDMALMRAIPHSTVIDISDGNLLRFVLRDVKDRRGLTYIRTSRKNYEKLYADGSAFKLGKGNVLRDGKDLTIIASGIMVAESLKAAAALEGEGISARVVDMFTVKPLDVELVARCAAETGAIVTAENHNVIGGLGSAVAEALGETCPVPMRRVGVADEFGEVGPEDYLRKRFKLTPEEIAIQARHVVLRKK